MLPGSESLAECCAALYSHPLARWLLGDSLHPGGLKLTTEVARLAGVEAESRVLDAGSGRGASAVHLAKTFKCHVMGVTLEEAGVAAGYEEARRNHVEELVTFRQGDLLSVELGAGFFDVVLMECVLSILQDKEAALSRLGEALRPGGRLAITDVTVSGPLPSELQGLLTVAGCVGDARSLEEYRRLVEAQGFTVERTQDLRETAESLLKGIKGKVLMAEIALKLGKLPVSPALLNEGKRILGEVQALVADGVLGYGLIVARKPVGGE